MNQSDDPASTGAPRLLSLVDGLARELHPDRSPPPVTLDSHLERDLGLDSLARVELLLRIEQAFGRPVPEHSAMAAQTPVELLRSLGETLPPAATAAPAATATDAAPPWPADATTLVDTLAWYAERAPERVHVHLYGAGETIEPLRHGDLWQTASAVAGGLRERAVEPGDCVAIMLPTGADFFFAYYGILLAGAVPVPIYPPASRARLEDHLRRQAAILNNARSPLLITTDDAAPVARLLQAQVRSLRHVCDVADLRAAGRTAQVPADATDLALIQYTSGSTGQPKGVALSHANLLANVRAMGQAAGVSADDTFVSWLPLYHDMGLIGACFGSLYHAIPLVLMSPLAFVSRPQRWLRAIERHRGTLSAAPNFAYDLCASRLRDQDLEGLDLSSWRLAFCGAEPVQPDTVERFCTRFAPYGFRRTSFTPVYGLAESSVGLAFPPLERGPRIDRVERDALLARNRAVPAAADDADALRFVACGRPLPGHEIRIVDAAGREVPDRRQGRLRFRGPSATTGYYRNPAATATLMRDGWLDSGDYAYSVDGEVYLTGRAKEVIIRAGRNLYPYELEQAVGELEGIRKDAVAVFAAPDPAGGPERLVVLAETRERDAAARTALRRRIEALAVDLMEGSPDDVVLAPPRTVLKTSSGKIRRGACRDLYLRGEADRPRPLWRQYLGLGLAALRPAAARLLGNIGERLYAGYAWTLFGTGGLLTWCLVAAAPTPRIAWSVARTAMGALLLLAGDRLTVHGRQHLPRDGTFVLAANHASYLDALVLAAALGGPLCYVAKRELRGHFFARVLLERLGTVFVERFDPRQGARDAGQLADRLRAGDRLAVFPEGTFTRAAGLRPFRMGAFTVAAAAGVPVVPVAVHGTRALLRGDEWFPRRGAVTVTVQPAITPAGNDWNAALELRRRVRTAILADCGEPDLGEAPV